jgi:predicted DNA-binding transcriptional regulator AlpA
MSKFKVSKSTDSRFLNEKQVAKLAGMSASWLQKLRMLGEGPSFYKLGKAVRYAESDVLLWLESQRAA